MPQLTVEVPTELGLNPTYNAAAAGGDSFKIAHDERTFLYFKNTDVAARTITITAQETSAHVPGKGVLTRSDIVINVPAASERISPAIPRAFADANGLGQMTYDADTLLTIAVVRTPQP